MYAETKSLFFMDGEDAKILLYKKIMKCILFNIGIAWQPYYHAK